MWFASKRIRRRRNVFGWHLSISSFQLGWPGGESFFLLAETDEEGLLFGAVWAAVLEERDEEGFLFLEERDEERVLITAFWATSLEEPDEARLLITAAGGGVISDVGSFEAAALVVCAIMPHALTLTTAVGL